MLGYLMDQSMRIENATKKPTTVIPFSDYGVDLIATSILVSKDTISSQARSGPPLHRGGDPRGRGRGEGPGRSRRRDAQGERKAGDRASW